MARGIRWKMDAPCAQCPFNLTGPGRLIWLGLRPGRRREILRELRHGSYFPCHKTTIDQEKEAPSLTPGELFCAGALAYQASKGVTSNYQRVAERLDAARATRQAKGS